MKLKVNVLDITNTVSQDEVDAGRLQESFEISVENGKKVTLSDAFSTELRTDLIKLAVASKAVQTVVKRTVHERMLESVLQCPV